MNEMTATAEEPEPAVIRDQAAQWFLKTSNVYLNLGQEIVVTTEDRLFKILTNHLAKIEKGRAWTTWLGVFIAIMVVFPTTTFRDFLFMPADTWRAIFILGAWISGGLTIGLLWQSRAFASVISRLRSPRRPITSPIEDLIAEIKTNAIPKETAEAVLATQESQIIFSDRFDSFDGWQQYEKGSVCQSKEVTAYSGSYCLKKDTASDPNGGFKQFGKTIGPGLVLSGWLLGPAKREGGKADRIALENSDFDGFGFTVDRASKKAWIERRQHGRPAPVAGSIVPFTPPRDQWYKFQLLITAEGRARLFLSNRSGEELLSTPEVACEEPLSFDRIVIHGGFAYYVDELMITRYQT